MAALVVLGISIWILVDQPSFLKVLNVTDDVIGGIGVSILGEKSLLNKLLTLNNSEPNPPIFQDVQIYQSATIALIVLSVLVIIVTFFGCCGASQESRCLLATVSKTASKIPSIFSFEMLRNLFSILLLMSCSWLEPELEPILSSLETWRRCKNHSWRPWKDMTTLQM